MREPEMPRRLLGRLLPMLQRSYGGMSIKGRLLLLAG